MHNFTDNVDLFRQGPIHDPFSNEPTYLTFSIDFLEASSKMSIIDESTGLPISPLFDMYSGSGAYQYLMNRGYVYQADQLYRFVDKITEISESQPWFFQTISGLNDLWKSNTDTSNPMKGNDKKIIVETLESLDLSITYLADLYRKACYDQHHMREILPENLRWFAMSVMVAEFRNIHLTTKLSNNELDSDDSVKMMQNYSFQDKYKTYLEYRCILCEFDFSETAPIDKLQVYKPDVAKNKFGIKTGWYAEKNSFLMQDSEVPPLIGGSAGTWVRPTIPPNSNKSGQWKKPNTSSFNKTRNDFNNVSGYFKGKI